MRDVLQLLHIAHKNDKSMSTSLHVTSPSHKANRYAVKTLLVIYSSADAAAAALVLKPRFLL
jgi:hypothetical protein